MRTMLSQVLVGLLKKPPCLSLPGGKAAEGLKWVASSRKTAGGKRVEQPRNPLRSL